MNCGGTIRLNPIGIAVLVFLGLLSLFFLFRSDKSGESYMKSRAELSVPLVDHVSLKQLLSVSIHAAQNGGKEVVAVKKGATMNEKSKGKTKEGANDPVTDGDLRSHIQMYFGIKGAFPFPVTVISEEKNKVNLNTTNIMKADNFDAEVDAAGFGDELVPLDDVTVWIDPLDATKEYTEDLRQYVTTMVCVAVKGKPVIGVIHKPFEDYTSWGWVNHGVSKSLSVAKKVEKNHTNVIVSRSHAGNVESVVNKYFGKRGEVTPAGGAGYKTLEVIKGNADVYVHITLIKKWDICAGNAILNALDGKMTTLQGGLINYDAVSMPEDARNDKGLIAALHQHQSFLEKFKDVKL